MLWRLENSWRFVLRMGTVDAENVSRMAGPKHLSPEDADRYAASMAVRRPRLSETGQKIVLMMIALVLALAFSSFTPSLWSFTPGSLSSAFGGTASYQTAIAAGEADYDIPAMDSVADSSR